MTDDKISLSTVTVQESGQPQKALRHSAKPRWMVLNYGFRSFFLLNGLFAVCAVAGWLLLLHGKPWPGAPASPLFWHIHEMLFGFAAAAIAGFLLTAVPAWTGQSALQGVKLGGLAAAWLLGRLAMLFNGALPPWLVAVADLLFPLLLAAVVMRYLLSAGNRRNYLIGGLICLFPIANAVYHLGVLGILTDGQRIVYLVPHLVILLVTIIGGRIIPAFTGNWLKLQGYSGQLPVTRRWLEGATLLVTIAAGIALGTSIYPQSGAMLALAAAIVHTLRLAGWRGWKTFSNPLLAILHVAYGWLIIAYLLFALSAISPLVTKGSALHALTIGAIGTMILAVMSRVALAHTGRPLQAARLTVLAYLLISLAALARIAAPLSEHYQTMIGLTGLFWIGGFGLFVWVYWPVLTQPRVDGKPG